MREGCSPLIMYLKKFMRNFIDIRTCNIVG